ncbi:phosphatidylinositol 3,4,5-trisphosphate 3-phosphatase and dual-specificity protein phosphatase PTEN isoform X2 [Bemisia tabaci]|uniref:phosphatidylinositol 3,4,5-trisphosphate 3-phosphatase and dual-specificity protein phosphatase PTEN isoform X2 n=1 Tax=Bemisia tabaci TaxID=7038 RepID=UPI0008F98592|nr:PREDICTED: phosphatidylinositol 3,4,5-trisphosphate 3-phosphatase and dual-specificity protein phosphatase PTEN isoform X2 [Bemisia tabaci]
MRQSSSTKKLAPNVDPVLKMANTISNMRVANSIKGLVSKKKKRYTEDGFNLDLTYITSNLIAMGYPAAKIEGFYRNHIDEVVKFLEEKHRDHYKIYNLCSERSYDINKFQSRVATYPFDDHNPPKMETIQPFCEDVHSWLSAHESNVAAVHCKAGKGRTGVMVCCYMLYCQQFKTAQEALSFYGQKRTTDTKGVTIPSQRRYVGYFASLVNEGLTYKPVTMFIREIIIQPLPTIFSNAHGCLQFQISNSNTRLHSSESIEVKKGSPFIHITMDQCIPLEGDVKVEFSHKPKMMLKEKMFHFWFNTFFIRERLHVPEIANGKNHFDSTHPRYNSHPVDSDTNLFTLRIDKWDLDVAHKDKQNSKYSPDLKVSLILQQVERDTPWSRVQRGINESTEVDSSLDSSSSEESEESEESWESGVCENKMYFKQ